MPNDTHNIDGHLTTVKPIIKQVNNKNGRQYNSPTFGTICEVKQPYNNGEMFTPMYLRIELPALRPNEKHDRM